MTLEYSVANMGKFLVKPNIVPPLDEDFRPASLANRKYEKTVKKSFDGVPIATSYEEDNHA